MQAICLLLLSVASTLAAANDIRTELALARDPAIELPTPLKPDTTRLTALWFSALKRPEAEMQRLAAEAIERAHAAGIPGLAQARSDLVRIVSADNSHPTARHAAARALIALGAKDAAGELQAAAARHGSTLRQVIEPALAAWDHRPMREIWLARLRDGKTHRRELLLAVAALGTVRETQAGALCVALASDGQQPIDLRLVAARAAGNIQTDGWEDAARQLAGPAQAPLASRLCAAALLSRHRSAAAQQLLTDLAQDAEPSVAASALSSLIAIDPKLVLPLAEASLKNADATVRQRAAEVYVLHPTPERVKSLVALLDDPHLHLRRQVRDDLFKLSQSAELDSVVRDGAMAMLAGESWRGQEQAALLLAALDHKPAADRLVELLESSRPEVMVATAWGLRKLAVPETLPKILDRVTRQTDMREGEELASDLQVAHLCEALGLMKYSPAEPVLRRYIPKRQQWELSRCGAIWALGHLHAGQPDEELAQLLVERLTDPAVIDPELGTIRMMSAVSLGRMKAASQVKPMRDWMGTIDPNPLDLAIRWGLMEITGENLPLPPSPPGQRGSWFLEPLEPAGG